MIATHALLVYLIVEFFNEAFTTIMYLSTSCTHVQALVGRMSFAVILLALISLPTPTIVMLSRSAVGAIFLS